MKKGHPCIKSSFLENAKGDDGHPMCPWPNGTSCIYVSSNCTPFRPDPEFIHLLSKYMLSHLVNGFCWNRPHGSSLSLCLVCYKRVCPKAEQIKACLTWLSLVHALPMHMAEVLGLRSLILFRIQRDKGLLLLLLILLLLLGWEAGTLSSAAPASVPVHENECTERQVPLLPGGKTTVSWRHSACSVHLSVTPQLLAPRRWSELKQCLALPNRQTNALLLNPTSCLCY